MFCFDLKDNKFQSHIAILKKEEFVNEKNIYIIIGPVCKIDKGLFAVERKKLNIKS